MVEKREPVLGISSGGFPPTPMRKNDMIFYRSTAKAREVAAKKSLEVKRAEKAAAMAELSKRNEEPTPKVPIRSKRKLDMVGLLEEFAHAGPPRRKR